MGKTGKPDAPFPIFHFFLAASPATSTMPLSILPRRIKDRGATVPSNLSNPLPGPFFNLLHKAREGSPSALGALLEDSRRYLRCLAYRRPGSDCDWRERPSDAVQDTMVAAVRYFLQVPGT